MGRHKFEDQFRVNLEKREIKPSEGSWQKLASRMETEEKKSRPLFWWIGIAASITGLIFIAALFFNSDPIKNTPVIVETPSVEKSDTEKQAEPFEVQKDITEGIAGEEVTEKKDQLVKPERNFINKREEAGIADVAEKEKPTPDSEEKSITRLASVDPGINLPVTDEPVQLPTLEKDPEIAAKMNAVLAEIANLEKSGGEVGEAEVDMLLARAATQISKNRKERFSSDKIDAEALLWDVEMEMENSFREKIFEVMKEGFLKARTAVANRNN